MNLRRFTEVARQSFARTATRPLTWVLIVLLALMAWSMSVQGGVMIQSGDSDTGGEKVWITSEFAVSAKTAMLVFLLYGFFVAVAAGMVVIQDDEDKVGELLHSTSLSTREYIWGKWLGVVACFFLVLGLHMAFFAFGAHVIAGADRAELIGPFVVSNYLRPAMIFGVPFIVFMAGLSFGLGTWTRKAIPVFFLPTALMLSCVYFFWEWEPPWLPMDNPKVAQLLACLDPSGYRWLNETWLKVDRGVQFYNHQQVALDLGFTLSRVIMIACGLATVHLAERRFAKTLRGTRGVKSIMPQGGEPDAVPKEERHGPVPHKPLSELGMKSRIPGLLTGIIEIMRTEVSGLLRQPGFYLFVPLILLLTIDSMYNSGPFGTPMLSTSGQLAAACFGSLTLMVGLLLLFYTVESLEREKSRGLAPIYYAAPVRGASILFGKAFANSVVGVVILFGAFVGNVILLLIQGKTPIELRPFVLIWGLLIVPTYFVWSAFVMAVYGVTRNRYTCYAVSLGCLVLTGYLANEEKLNWAIDWPLWGSAVSWSDLGPFELDRSAWILNRLLFLSVGVALTAFAVKMFPRREMDPSSVLLRCRPKSVGRAALRFSPYLIVPCVLFGWLLHLINAGPGGEAMKKKGKDYWRKNLAIWRDEKKPSIAELEVDLELKPHESWFRTKGHVVLVNDHEKALDSFTVTPGEHFEKMEWKLDGEDVEPENRAGLLVFQPKREFGPGDKVELEFSFHGMYPSGISKNGGEASEFILPSGAVLVGGFLPSIGYSESIGVDDENRYDAKEYPDDFYEGMTASGFGNNTAFSASVTIHIPEEYTANSVGELVDETVTDGIRTAVWKSDYPVEWLNVICGKWKVKRGNGTALFYHPAHEYNVDEIVEALDAAREHYSEWFFPFPWKELKVSEFAAHASYAQGLPTNITFSEGIGFLAKSDPRTRVAFFVTAHEAAHQWWGNLLVPGKGPGGNILSEGMAHFSTILLLEEERGLRERIEFCRRIESTYGWQRRVNSEKPMVKTIGSRSGDGTVTYDKGGWVFWMLLNHMGRDNALAGLQAFIRKYHHNPDHPVLQDFVQTMREFAPDRDAYDAFTRQWFFEVVVPEYNLIDPKQTDLGDGKWEVTVEVKNKGTGRMPVEVCASKGKRFPDEDQPEKDDGKSSKDEEYQDARVVLDLVAGESKTATIRCNFKPARVLVDPDALVLQLRREEAQKEL